MVYKELLSEIETGLNISLKKTEELHSDELYVWVDKNDFRSVCEFLHKKLRQPVSMFFAEDQRDKEKGFIVYCVFKAAIYKKWIFVCIWVNPQDPRFDSLSKTIYSASLFERELSESFGIIPSGSPDMRRLRLHDEVWPAGAYPLRKDHRQPDKTDKADGKYVFSKVEGEGVFEVPVGPVHAGIIGPGHFRFSAAGEPIINLETRLGFTHRGAEKLFEGKTKDAVSLSECISGDSTFCHSLAFCTAMEKIHSVSVPISHQYMRAIFLELERMYNHTAGIAGIAVDVGFSFPSAYAAIIKESLQSLNMSLTGSRFLKGVNRVGGVGILFDETKKKMTRQVIGSVTADLKELVSILNSSVSFMDRVDSTGILKKKTAEDLGVQGMAGRASGIHSDLRRDFAGIYDTVSFAMCHQDRGDVLSRLLIRIAEFEGSARLINAFIRNMPDQEPVAAVRTSRQTCALGYAEGWRGPVLYWISTDSRGVIQRCKIVDQSFLNWQGLCYCVLGEIIPDFPVCNKSFDLSYSGTDL